jgi:hypothetical protein
MHAIRASSPQVGVEMRRSRVDYVTARELVFDRADCYLIHPRASGPLSSLVETWFIRSRVSVSQARLSAGYEEPGIKIPDHSLKQAFDLLTGWT